MDQWLHSEKINDFDSFKELILLENFLSHVPKDVATHITDKRTKTVADAAIIADEYNLIHRSDSDKLYKQCKGKGVDF